MVHTNARYNICMHSSQRGVTLLDTLVGTSLMLVVFMGISAAFRLSVDVITTNKARAGGIALANERIEYLRSLPYTQLGTSGGVPAGALAQTESITLNGVPYTRRTLIQYADDPRDGSGAADTNSITADYKIGRIDVSWESRSGVRHITIASRFSPIGIETAVPGGTLVISAVNAAGATISGAQVRVVNASTSPAIDTTTFTNASGTVTIIGAPASANYQITVSDSGYSTAQTYSTTPQNTNPSPANLTVTEAHTTNGTFAIDILGNATVRTWTPIQGSTWEDTLADASKTATTSNTEISGGELRLAGSAPYPLAGDMQSIALGPSRLAQWTMLSWDANTPPGTSARVSLYNSTGSALIPDAQLPGNSTGFTTSPIDLSGISTSTYALVRVGIHLETADDTVSPSITSYRVDSRYGPTPLPNITFGVRGNKTLGSGPLGTLYKYDQSFSSGVAAGYTVPSLEWDTYTISVGGATGYDISSSCPAQPQSLAPGASLITDIHLLPHTTHSLLVHLRSGTTSAPIAYADITLSRTGFSTTTQTDACGHAFFSDLVSSSAYSVSASSTGYTTTAASTTVSGTSATELLFN